MRAVANHIVSLSALAIILLAAGCGSKQETGLLALSLSADPQIPAEAASKLVVTYPGGSAHVYQGTFPPRDRGTLPMKLQVPNLPANNTPAVFTVQGFDSNGCAVTKPATTTGVVIKAGAETALIPVTLLKSDTNCADGGTVIPPVDGADAITPARPDVAEAPLSPDTAWDVPLGSGGAVVIGTGGLDGGSGGQPDAAITGGSLGVGGTTSLGGALASGGTTKAGGNTATGGILGTGGNTTPPGTGGTPATGGSIATGGTGTGGAGTGGAPPTRTLTLSTIGIATATGKATPNPMGASCGPGCFTFPEGQQVQISAVGDAPSLFAAWSGDCAGQGGTCSLTMSTDKTSVAHFRPNMNIMFVTEGTLTPSKIGANLASADAFCAQSAAAAFLGGSVWKAWLATSNVNAATHIGRSTPGWIRVDGLPFATSMTNLLAGKILYPPRITELNTSRSSLSAVLSGADENGNALPSGTCGDWSSAAGDMYTGNVTTTTVVWTYAGIIIGGCGTSLAPVYCFESDSGMAAVPAPVIPANARRAFLSHTPWVPGAGVSGADTICQNDATAASLANAANYRALLTTSVAATDPTRISLTGPPWYRLDGAQLVATAADLAAPAADKMLTSLTVDSSGAYVGTVAWTGNGVAPSATTSVENCGNWTSGSASATGRSGGTTASLFWWWAGNAQDCSQHLPLYCFER